MRSVPDLTNQSLTYLSCLCTCFQLGPAIKFRISAFFMTSSETNLVIRILGVEALLTFVDESEASLGLAPLERLDADAVVADVETGETRHPDVPRLASEPPLASRPGNFG